MGKLKNLHRQWSPSPIGIEAVADQLALIQEARRQGLPVRELRADRDRISRVLTVAARLETGQVYWSKYGP